MVDFKKYLEPNRKGFESDPFGYSALARHKWGMARTVAGFPKLWGRSLLSVLITISGICLVMI